MSTLLFLHVAVSLVGIVAGFVVMYGFLTSQRYDRWNDWFLATTIATSVSGFVLPADRILPAHVLGVLSLIVLAAAVAARYRNHLAGAWRGTYVVAALTAQYFNVFVLIVQAFQKVPWLHAAAPTQTEPAFAAVQMATVVGFVLAGVFAFYRYEPAAARS